MSQAPAAGPQYTIYTFDRPEPRQKGDTSWKRHSTITDMKEAIDQAQILLQTRRFDRVEVKKKFFDRKLNRTVDQTLKVFENRPKTNYLALSAGLMAGSILAFMAGYFLTAAL